MSSENENENVPKKETWRSGVFFGILSYLLVLLFNPQVYLLWWLLGTVFLSNTYRAIYLSTFQKTPTPEKVYPASYTNGPVDFNDPDWTDKVDWSAGDSVRTVPDPTAEPAYDPYDPEVVKFREEFLRKEFPTMFGRGRGRGGNPPLAPEQPERLLA